MLKKLEVASLYKEVQERQPSAMVLMGNHSLSLYTKLQEKYRAEKYPSCRRGCGCICGLGDGE